MLVPELIAIFIFMISSVFGFINLVQMLNNQPTSLLILICHGFAGLVGLTILFVQIYNGDYSPLLISSTILLSIAGLIDFFVLTMDLCKRKLPKILAVTHTLIAITGLIILIVYILK